jgi:hypothetical protein
MAIKASFRKELSRQSGRSELGSFRRKRFPKNRTDLPTVGMQPLHLLLADPLG